MRRNSRPPYALVPTLILLLGLLYWAMASGLKLSGGAFGLRGLERPVDRDSMNAHIAAGIDAKGHGDAHGAADYFLQAVGDAGEGSHAYVDVARELIGRNLAPEAFNLLGPKTQEFGWDPMFWSTLADAYTQADDKVRAADATRKAQQAAVALSGEESAKVPSADAHVAAARLRELGRYYRESRDPDGPKAIAALRAALVQLPNDPGVQSALGLTLAEMGTTQKEWNEAVSLTQKAVQPATDGGYPADSRYLDSYGWALFRSGDLAGARRALAASLEVEPNDAIPHFHLAKVYLALNDLASAGLELQRALLFRPRYPEAEEALKAMPSPLPQPTPVPTPVDPLLAPPAPASASPSPAASAPPGASATPSGPPMSSASPIAGASPSPSATPGASAAPMPGASATPLATPSSSASPSVVGLPLPIKRPGMSGATPTPSGLVPVVK